MIKKPEMLISDGFLFTQDFVKVIKNEIILKPFKGIIDKNIWRKHGT